MHALRTYEHSIETRLLGRSCRVSLHDRGSAERAELEEWIRRRFEETHQASIHEFLPYLLAIRNEDGSISACAGFGPARTAPLFLEQYLDQDIEELLRQSLDIRVDRSEIVEIGNLAASGRVGIPLLFLALDSLLKGLGFQCAAFTATRTVRVLLRRSSFPFVELLPADAGRLATGRGIWGSYYEADPRVLVIQNNHETPALPRPIAALIAACHDLGERSRERAA